MFPFMAGFCKIAREEEQGVKASWDGEERGEIMVGKKENMMNGAKRTSCLSGPSKGKEGKTAGTH